jgi:glutaredoxin
MGQRVSLSSLAGLALLVLAISAASSWWVGRQEAQIGRQLAALAQPGDIRMLASDSCGICVAARSWFKEHGVAYSECSIERDAACRQAFDAVRAPGTPVMLVRGVAQLGFNPERLRSALAPGA